LQTHKKNTKTSAQQSREYHVKRLSKYIAKIEVRQITKKMYQNVIDQMEKDGYSYNTIYSAHPVAKNIFKQAIAWDIIKSSPADMAILPKPKKTIEQIEKDEVAESYLEREELKTFLQIVDQYGLPSDDVIFTLLAFTGMRVGELLALKWKDVDFENKEFNITKTIFNVDGKKDEYKLLPPKTETSIRKITFDDRIAQLLKRQKQNEKKMQVRTIMARCRFCNHKRRWLSNESTFRSLPYEAIRENHAQGNRGKEETSPTYFASHSYCDVDGSWCGSASNYATSWTCRFQNDTSSLYPCN
jgi:integrase